VTRPSKVDLAFMLGCVLVVVFLAATLEPGVYPNLGAMGGETCLLGWPLILAYMKAKEFFNEF
jgi:hypothetical protein